VEIKMPASYSRQIILCASDILKELGHSGFNRFLLELNLPDESIGRGSGLMARATSLAEFAIKNPEALSPDRRTIAYEIILRATELWKQGTKANITEAEREKFRVLMNAQGLGEHLLEAEQDSVTIGGEDQGDGWTGSSMTFSANSLVKIREAMDMQRPTQNPSISRKIFIVHGHDGEARETVARFLSSIGLEPIILHEQANRGRTVIEKVEARV
jgi:hypothetical protein